MSNLLIDAIRMSAGGSAHEHTHIFGPSFGVKTRFDGVSDIFYGRHSYYTQGNLLSNQQTPVGRVAANHAVLSQADYLRTHANGKWTDNLLALPRR